MQETHRSNKYSQEISVEIQQLNNLPTDNVYKLRERNIRKLAESYLLTAENAVKAKRGRNIEKYTQYYKECTEMYDVLNTYIYSLNNETFRINSESFNTLIGSLRYSEVLCLSIFVIVSLMNVLLIVLLTGTITRPELGVGSCSVMTYRTDGTDVLVIIKFW